ncbi:hypothetical protein D3C81_1299280 [compost metagenome]
MKRLISILFLSVLLTGCGTSSEPVITKNDTDAFAEKTIIIKATQRVEVNGPKQTKNFSDGITMKFNGYVNQLEDGWIISISENGNWAVNDYFVVKEGTTIDFFGHKLDVIKLDPYNNQITLKENNH